MTLGIDQSKSNTGLCILDKNKKLIYTSSIPTFLDFLKFYKDYNRDTYITNQFMYSEAFTSGLVDNDVKLTKKRKDLTIEEKAILKVPNEISFNYIANELEKIFKMFDIKAVGIETISFGSMGSTADLGRLLGYIERTVYNNDAKLYRYEPTKVKMYAGKGNFDKEQMLEATPKEYRDIILKSCPRNTKGNFVGLDDRIDSFWIASLAHRDRENA